jgi:hypothetical protein
MLPRQIAEQILTVLDSMEAKLDQLAEAVGVNGSDYDAADRRSVRRAGQADV